MFKCDAVLAWAEELHGYKLAKYEYVAGLAPWAMSNDVFPFRYTDVLMMKAECRCAQARPTRLPRL